jgi:transposase
LASQKERRPKMLHNKIVDKLSTNKQLLHPELDGYDYYIALDWSKVNMAIAKMTKHGRGNPQVIDVPTSIKELKVFLMNLKGKKILTIEETTTAQWLYVELLDYVDKILICDPYRNKLLSEGPKNDKIDASKLCLLLKSGMLKEVYHSTDKLYKLRKYVSSYEDIIKAGVRLLNQRTAVYQGIGLNSKTAELQLDKTEKFIMNQYDKGVEIYEENKSQYKEYFRKLCKKEATLKALISIPGIGEVSAVKILSRVINAHRFRNAGKYLAYCGLVKHKKESGHKNYGIKNPRYNRIMKSAYKTAAMVAIGFDNPIREYYDYLIGKGVAEHNARNAAARYIAKISFGIMKTNKKYEPYRWRESSKPEKR